MSVEQDPSQFLTRKVQVSYQPVVAGDQPQAPSSTTYMKYSRSWKMLDTTTWARRLTLEPTRFRAKLGCRAQSRGKAREAID